MDKSHDSSESRRDAPMPATTASLRNPYIQDFVGTVGPRRGLPGERIIFEITDTVSEHPSVRKGCLTVLTVTGIGDQLPCGAEETNEVVRQQIGTLNPILHHPTNLLPPCHRLLLSGR